MLAALVDAARPPANYLASYINTIYRLAQITAYELLRPTKYCIADILACQITEIVNNVTRSLANAYHSAEIALLSILRGTQLNQSAPQLHKYALMHLYKNAWSRTN